MISPLKNIIQKNEFNPSWIGIITNPFFIARRGLSESIKEFGSFITDRTIDIGCGTKPYRKFFNSTEYLGLEYDTGIDTDKKAADFYYSGDKFPFENESFNSAVCNQVLEHIFNPEIFLSETNRILKQGGRLLLTVPFVWDEHEQPYDFARYSSFALIHLLESNGFKVIHNKKSTKDFKVIIQLVDAYLYKITKKIPLVKQIVQILIIFPFTLFGIIASSILPDNQDLYLDNIILAEKSSKKMN